MSNYHETETEVLGEEFLVRVYYEMTEYFPANETDPEELPFAEISSVVIKIGGKWVTLNPSDRALNKLRDEIEG